MDELVIDNLVYIPSKKAAAITGYAKDYIGQLCREGRIEAKLVGRSWYVLESSIKEHRFGRGEAVMPLETAKIDPITASRDVEVHQEVPEPAPVIEEVAPVWESPVYVPEPVEEILPSRLTTSLENTYTPENTEKIEATSQIEEVQNAWQEWFSRNESSPQVTPVEEPVLEVSGEQYVPLEEVNDLEEEEETVEPTPVTLHKTRTVGGSMDISQREPQPARFSARSKPKAQRDLQSKRSSGTDGRRVILQAAFVALIVITAAITIVGTGTLDVFSPSWAGTSPAIDFLAGVKSIEK